MPDSICWTDKIIRYYLHQQQHYSENFTEILKKVLRIYRETYEKGWSHQYELAINLSRVEPASSFNDGNSQRSFSDIRSIPLSQLDEEKSSP